MIWGLTAAVLFVANEGNGISIGKKQDGVEKQDVNEKPRANQPPLTEEMLTVRQGRQAQLLQAQAEDKRLKIKLAKVQRDFERNTKELEEAKTEIRRQQALLVQGAGTHGTAQKKTKKKRAAIAAVVSRYSSSSVGKPSKFRDSLALLLESIIDVNARSEWELVPVALCLKGEDNVPQVAADALEQLGFAVKMADPVVELADISKDAGYVFIKEIHKDYGFGGIFRDYLKLRAMQWTEFDRVLVLDSDTMLIEPIDDILDGAEKYQLTTTPDWPM
jgi:hypothetical protein